MKTEQLTTFKRDATRILGRLREDKEPVLITEHGRPAAYLVEAGRFEEQQRRMAMLEVIARGEQAIREGRTVSQEEAKERMGRWFTE